MTFQNSTGIRVWEVPEMKDRGIYGGPPASLERIAQAKVTTCGDGAHVVLFKKDKAAVKHWEISCKNSSFAGYVENQDLGTWRPYPSLATVRVGMALCRWGAGGPLPQFTADPTTP